MRSILRIREIPKAHLINFALQCSLNPWEIPWDHYNYVYKNIVQNLFWGIGWWNEIMYTFYLYGVERIL